MADKLSPPSYRRVVSVMQGQEIQAHRFMKLALPVLRQTYDQRRMAPTSELLTRQESG